MKALFIIHCQDPIYGASRSVGNLIRNLDADIDIIFPFKIKRDGITKEQIAKFYGSRVGRVWFLPQPAREFVQPGHLSPVAYVKCFVKDILYLLFKPIYAMIYKRGYDFIHLNSSTVFPMISRKLPMFIHMREALRERHIFWNRRFKKRLDSAHGIICISEEVRRGCPESTAPSIVLINPYDQTHVAEVDLSKARKRFGLKGDETVYALIGNIHPKKGVNFVIGAFRKAKLENAVLLIIGKDSSGEGYEAEARKLAGGDPRIRFVGELSDMDEAYRVIDYAVRGDEVAGAGRTVFESLYSGGGVLLMGTREENLAPLELPQDMAERVHFYPPRDENGLIEAFEQTQHCRFVEREYIGNIPQYVKRFMEFIKSNKDRRL